MTGPALIPAEAVDHHIKSLHHLLYENEKITVFHRVNRPNSVASLTNITVKNVNI